MTRAPADVEAVLVALLPAPSGTHTPNPRPAGGFTKVSRAGGDRLNVVQGRPRLLVECWAANEVAAFQRAQAAWGAIAATRASYVHGVWISAVELTEPVNFPDPDTKSPRYQFVAQLTTSLQELP